MPHIPLTTPDGKKVKFNHPEGAPDEEIQEQIDSFVGQYEASRATGEEIRRLPGIANQILPEGPSLTEQRLKAFARGALPTAAALATGGLSIPAQMAIQGGVEGLMQGTGIAEPNPLQAVLAASLPPGLKFGTTVGRGLRKGAAEIVTPSGLRGAGVETVAERIGQPMTTVERVFKTPASQALYQAAKAQGGLTAQDASLVRNAIRQTIDDYRKLPNHSKAALKMMRDFEINVAARPAQRAEVPTGLVGLQGQSLFKEVQTSAATEAMDYDHLIRELQILNLNAGDAFRGGNSTLGQALKDVRNNVMGALNDSGSPAIRVANTAYYKEASAREILNQALRPGDVRAKIAVMLEREPAIGKAFGPDAIKDVMNTAELMSTVASSQPVGGWRQMLSALMEPVEQMFMSDKGREALRSMMKNAKTPREFQTKLNTAAQMLRTMPEIFSKEEKLRGESKTPVVNRQIKAWAARRDFDPVLGSLIVESEKDPNRSFMEKMGLAEVLTPCST